MQPQHPEVPALPHLAIDLQGLTAGERLHVNGHVFAVVKCQFESSGRIHVNEHEGPEVVERVAHIDLSLVHMPLECPAAQAVDG